MFPLKGWALSSVNKLQNYLNILQVCFASFFLASHSRDVYNCFKNFTISDIYLFLIDIQCCFPWSWSLSLTCP